MPWVKSLGSWAPILAAVILVTGQLFVLPACDGDTSGDGDGDGDASGDGDGDVSGDGDGDGDVSGDGDGDGDASGDGDGDGDGTECGSGPPCSIYEFCDLHWVDGAFAEGCSPEDSEEEAYCYRYPWECRYCADGYPSVCSINHIGEPCELDGIRCAGFCGTDTAVACTAANDDSVLNDGDFLLSCTGGVWALDDNPPSVGFPISPPAQCPAPPAD